MADIKGGFNEALSGLTVEALYVLLPETSPMWLGSNWSETSTACKGTLWLIAGANILAVQTVARSQAMGVRLLCFLTFMTVDVDGHYIKS
eukprot:5542216-Amphidinium_carterae.3